MRQIHLDTVDSTNTYAKLHCDEFDGMTCVVAEEQTAGRGRYERKWVSPRGVNLYATFYFQLEKDALHIGSLAQVMAYSLAMVLIKEGLKPKIKWPNDIQLGGKKISGILCETVFGERLVDIFLGIGVNVNMEEMGTIDQPATSLKLETGRNWDRAALLKKLQKQFTGDLELFKERGFEPFHSPFENLLAYKGQTVRCFDGKVIWEGICHSLTQEGQMNLKLPDGTIHVVRSGDLRDCR